MTTEAPITYKTDLEGVDWKALKAALAADNFDNGRTPRQLEESFRNSYAVVFACGPEGIIGKARALSDGVCNAYVVDVWTHSRYRRQGIASRMMETLLDRLQGQHVYLFTEDAMAFYGTLGFKIEGIGMGKVAGKWLRPG